VVRRFLILYFFLFGSSYFGWAQAPVAASQAANTENVTLGQSAVPLYGPWKFTIGDSPLDPATHQPLWAEPGFDDSKWETVDLTPAEGATDPIAGISGYVPGWTMKGHPGYWGYAWYRIRVRLNAQPGEKLALAGPSDVDDAYQFFANSSLLGSFGDFSGSRPVAYNTQPMMFPMPQPAREGPTTMILAFRFWMHPNTLLQVDAGGMHNAPLLGEAGTVDAEYQTRWLEMSRSYATTPIFLLLDLLLVLTAVCLAFFDRSDRVYLWLGGVYLIAMASNILFALMAWTQTLSGVATSRINDVFLPPLSYAGWVMVWWVWFRLRRPAWLPGAALGLGLLLGLSNALGENLWFTILPQAVSSPFHAVAMVVRLACTALSLWIVYQGIRLHGVEGWLVLPVIVLSGVSRFTNELLLLHLSVTWFPFGVTINLGTISGLLLPLVLALLLLRRLNISLKRQRRMALDVKQAQEVQQVILPPARMTLPGLEIESEYRPALEVGGDFFQIIPHPTDGSLLIVAGDVAGKGLRSGMLVALLVGAIRSTVHFSFDPKIVLGELNERLLGRGDAQATCLALRIDANGAVTLANAGHLPPYLNGAPLAMEGALPLGMLAGAVFSVMNFKLAEGDRLLLLSDGIAEARDADGQLFSFERVEQLLQSQPSAAELASAAQAFGQQDDISVISVTRIAPA
jgi:sulfur transfer complex TusBCD TusB component (DsrH family)